MDACSLDASASPRPEPRALVLGWASPTSLGGRGVGARVAEPVVADGLVVAGLPDVGAGHAAVHIVAQQIFLVLRPVPLHHHRGSGVPGREDAARRRGHRCRDRRAGPAASGSGGHAGGPQPPRLQGQGLR